jgi:hypothetical protein
MQNALLVISNLIWLDSLIIANYQMYIPPLIGQIELPELSSSERTTTILNELRTKN